MSVLLRVVVVVVVVNNKSSCLDRHDEVESSSHDSFPVFLPLMMLFIIMNVRESPQIERKR